MATWNKPAGFRFIVRNRGMYKKKKKETVVPIDRLETESTVLKPVAKATLKDRIRECPEYDCFTTVALSCHREIVPEVILYYYDVYCNNKYYISTFYKKNRMPLSLLKVNFCYLYRRTRDYHTVT